MKLVSKKAAIPLVFAAIGLVTTTIGMFTVLKELVWTGVGFWIASVIASRMLKKKPKSGEENKTS